MARNLSPKCKQCRREGTKLFLKGERCSTSKCSLVRRSYIPGMHGPKQQGKPSRMTGYGIQLREKQKAKRTYRILERQFFNYFTKAKETLGDTGANIFKHLEMRLDNVVFRAGFAVSRDLARQLVSHAHVLVNGKRVDIPSYQVKVKDKISIKKTTAGKDAFKTLAEGMKGKQTQDWLVVDPETMTATIVDFPTPEKNKPGFDLRAIVEYYSK